MLKLEVVKYPYPKFHWYPKFDILDFKIRIRNKKLDSKLIIICMNAIYVKDIRHDEINNIRD